MINFQLDEMDAYRLIEYLKLAKRPLMSVSAKNSIDDIRETIETQLKGGLMDRLIIGDPYFDITTAFCEEEEPLQVSF